MGRILRAEMGQGGHAGRGNTEAKTRDGREGQAAEDGGQGHALQSARPKSEPWLPTHLFFDLQ